MAEELDFQQVVEELREMAGDDANGMSDEELVREAMQSCVALAKQCLHERHDEWQVADLVRARRSVQGEVRY